MSKWEIIAALLAVGFSMINQLKAIGAWFMNLFMVSHAVDYVTARWLMAYLANNSRSSTTVGAYSSAKGYIRPLNDMRTIPYEWLYLASSKFILLGFRPLLFRKTKEGNNGFDYVFSYIRGTVNWERVMMDGAEWKDSVAQKSAAKRFSVHYHHGKALGVKIDEDEEEPKGGAQANDRGSWSASEGLRLLGPWTFNEIGAPTGGELDDLALTPDISALIDEIVLWSRLREWYSVRKIPWKRGYAFHGAPGTGKTTIVRGLGLSLDMPIHVFDIATMSNEDMRKAWTKMCANTPCIALFEDVDAVFNKRENVTKFGGLASSGGLTFDCLLNCLDGVERNANGVLVIMTTNDVDKLDEALLDRPGRIDRVVQFGDLDLLARRKLANILIDDPDEANRIAEDSDDMPAAKFQERCCRIALEKKFNGAPFR